MTTNNSNLMPMQMKYSGSNNTTKEEQIPLKLNIVRVEELFVHAHLIDALLGKLKRSKENRIDDARPRHGHAKTAVHAWIQELDLGSGGFVAAASEAVALVDAFGSVDGEDLWSS
jgi:hypothetical protein